MLMASVFPVLAFFLLLTAVTVSSDLLLEDGYTVTTVIDGHKLAINPCLVLARPPSDLVVLDSSRSLFYTIPFPLSEESVVKQLAGDGVSGFSDGEPGRAQFNRPKSFAVDGKRNVYVADKGNHAIRKISSSSGYVSTIAGGYSTKAGRQDGPSQNATFSDDFELAFVPEGCLLLVADHGNQLVRQIELKAEDCAQNSPSGVGAVNTWVLLGIALSFLVGSIIGFIVHPYVTTHDNERLVSFLVTWKRCQLYLERQAQMLCFGSRSVVASSMLYALPKRLLWLSLSHLRLMFRVSRVETISVHKVEDSVSLIDSDDLVGSDSRTFRVIADQLKDLINVDGDLDLANENCAALKQGMENRGMKNSLPCIHGKIDSLIEANFNGFAKAADETVPAVGSSNLVKRR